MAGIVDISVIAELEGLSLPPASFFLDAIAPVIILEPDNNPPGFIVPVINPLSSNSVYIRPTGRLNVSSQYEFAEVQITRTLNEHPTATATFYTTEIPSIVIGSQIQLLGINFVIESYSLNVFKGTTANAIAVNLSLIGQHAPRGSESPLHPLDIPVTFDVGTTRIDWGNIASRISTPVNINGTGYEKYYSGEEEIVLTPRAELEAASLLSQDAFIKYSTATITTIPSTGTGNIAILDAHILDEVAQVEVKDKPKYINVELILDFDQSDASSVEVSTRFEYENCVSFVDQRNPGGAGFILAETILDDLKDPGNTFDNGGRTKTSREIREKNGNPLWMVEEVYGYVFVSSQLFELPSGFADYEFMRANQNKWPLRFSAFPSTQNYWQLVQRTTTIYNYDSDGYLTRSTKTGWKLGRLKRESGEYEAANIWIDTFLNHSVTSNRTGGPSPKWKALAREYNAYMFSNPIEYAGDDPVFPNVNSFGTAPLFRYLINEQTAYHLSPLNDYYHDMNTSEGQPLPKFAYKTSSYSDYQEVQPNPKDDPSDPGSPYPPLIAHKEKKESSTVQVIVPPARNSPIKSPELYAVVDYVHSVEGDHSSSSLKIGNSTQFLGRPSTHTQLPLNPSARVPDSYSRYAEQRYLINSIEDVPSDEDIAYIPRVGSSTIPTPTSTVSFTGAMTPMMGERGAINSILRKSLNTVTTKIRVSFFEYYSVIEEGSKVTVAGTEYLVTGVSYSIKLYNPGEYYCPDGLNLSLSVVPSQRISIRSYDRDPN